MEENTFKKLGRSTFKFFCPQGAALLDKQKIRYSIRPWPVTSTTTEKVPEAPVLLPNPDMISEGAADVMIALASLFLGAVKERPESERYPRH